jgi:exopolysaccharide biosynthesis polyprenyl glycosylphosphotransferase
MVRQHQTHTILNLGSTKDEKQMVKKRRLHTLFYKMADYFSAMAAWALFFVYRRYLESGSITSDIFSDPNFWYGVALIPIGWTCFYAIFDQYKDIYRLSRLATFVRTLFLSFFGVLFLFFTLLLDDVVVNYTTYYTSFFSLMLLHFSITATSRMVLLSRAHHRIKTGRITFNTIVIGGNQNAYELYKEIKGRKNKLGYRFIGFIDTNGSNVKHLAAHIPKLGRLEDLRSIIKGRHVEEAIIAIESTDHPKIEKILSTLFAFDNRLRITIIPDMYDILIGTVKMNEVYGAVLIEIKQMLMANWQKVLKRLIDVSAATFMLVFLAPLYAYIALRVRMSSSGPILFKQERIGINGKPFFIYKFRSMYVDAEKNGPQLSKDGDSRCTPWGLTMRKLRLDELPQFWNVLKGDMSLVGPRPERQYYIDQIVSRAPHYNHLLKVRPGITSWGQVKYGYASNVDQMVQRLKFDILYIENMSLVAGFQDLILYYLSRFTG